jgi:hypothetical protein
VRGWGCLWGELGLGAVRWPHRRSTKQTAAKSRPRPTEPSLNTPIPTPTPTKGLSTWRSCATWP